MNEHSLWSCRIESHGSRLVPCGYCLVRGWGYIPLVLFQQFHKETFYRVRWKAGSYQERVAKLFFVSPLHFKGACTGMKAAGEVQTLIE